MIHASNPTDLLPNCLASDCSAALSFWLKNPLLIYHFEVKMKATALAMAPLLLTPELPEAQKEMRRVLMKLREKRGIVRASRRAPEGLIEETLAEQYDLFDRISDAAERSNVRAFAMRLLDCERPWLRAQLEAALDLRETLNHFEGKEATAPLTY